MLQNNARLKSLIVNNPSCNYGEFATIRSQAGLNSYKISVKEWVEKTSAVGLKATAGRYGGTYAHVDIALEFDMWIRAEFKGAQTILSHLRKK
ncbi:MAG: KilA-N domain-containing protein [Saprospiraceae bacterium]|nr:KilA-N domain-containing protein [Saprospiraceae bacterium]